MTHGLRVKVVLCRVHRSSSVTLEADVRRGIRKGRSRNYAFSDLCFLNLKTVSTSDFVSEPFPPRSKWIEMQL